MPQSMRHLSYSGYNVYCHIHICTVLSSMGFPGRSDGKEICLQCGRPRFDPWVGKILWRRKWQPTPILLPGKSHGQRSLVGCSPWGPKESDTNERLHFLSFSQRIWEKKGVLFNLSGYLRWAGISFLNNLNLFIPKILPIQNKLSKIRSVQLKNETLSHH